jgi:hypothetical protein
MWISRRRFIKTPIAAGAAGAWRALEADTVLPRTPRPPPAPRLYPAEIKVLAAYVDTLLPPEQDRPGASELGVHERLAASAKTKPRYLTLLQWGARWLHHQAKDNTGTGFAALDEAGRIAVVKLAEAGETTSRQRTFFEFSRQDAFRYYYANPQSWPGLGYAGPPQPLGFLDYTQPPPPASTSG